MSVLAPVDVLYGGPGREAPVSRKSGAAILQALRDADVDAVGVDCDQRCDCAALRPGSVVFNIIHGTYGEDGTLQAELDAAGRVYIGSDAAASRLCMDKARTKAVAAEAGVPVAWGKVIDPRQAVDPGLLRVPHGGPLVIKPVADGSSVGLRLLPSVSFLLPAIEELLVEIGPVPLLVEERLPGPEFTVTVLDDEAGAPQALPPLCILPAGESYDYQAKYERSDTAYTAVDDQARSDALRQAALTVYRACGCRDFARIDFIARADGVCCLMEVNTLPGFTDHSLVPKSAALVGLDFGELCRRLIARAACRLSEDHPHA